MKKLYVKQKVFSWVDKFTVKNENEQDCYVVEGDMIVIGGKKLHIKDMEGREVAMIQQKFFSLMPKFFVFMGGQQVAEIVKKFSVLKPKYAIEGLGWEVKGSILDHDYVITNSGETIITLHKAWLSWGDSYELTITGGVDQRMALAVVLAIDCVQQAQAEAAEANSSNND